MIFHLKRSVPFRREIEQWVAEGIITPAQAEQLFSRYELDREAPWYLQSGFWLRAVALLLGGMGLLLLLSQNWHRFGVPLQMAFGLAPLLLAYALGFRYEFRGNRSAAELTFFFASLAFGANIFLQAQIFHISAYYPNGVLCWIIGALPLAFYFRSRLHHGLVQVLFFIWMTQQLDYQQFSYWAVLLYPAMLYLLVRTPAALLFQAHIVNTFLFVFHLNSRFGHPDSGNLWLLFLFTAVLLTLSSGYFSTQYEAKMIEKMRRLGLLIALFIFYLHTFRGVIAEMDGVPHSPVLFVLAIATLFWRTAGDIRIFLSKWLSLGLFVLFWIHNSLAGNVAHFPSYAAVATNLVFFGLALWSIRHGIQNREKWWFMLGILLIILQALGRYLSLVGDYVLSAVIFILCGIFIWWINSYWHRRIAAGSTP